MRNIQKYLKSLYGDRLGLVLVILLLITIIFQVLLIARFSANNIIEISGDPAYYMKLILEKLDEHSFYPSRSDVYSDFMFAPGFIDYGILVMKIFGNPKAFLFLNSIFTILITIELCSIGKIIDNERTGKIAGIIFLLSTNNQGFSLFLLTQLPFAVFFLLSILLFLKKRPAALLFAGAALIISNWIRPLGFILLIGLIIQAIQSGSRGRVYYYFFAGVVVTLLIIGSVSYRNSGFFVYQSTTSGVNMRMGAHDNANGKYLGDAYSDDNITDQMNFIERNDTWKNNAIEWIKSNPGKFILLAPKKVYWLFSMDKYTLDGISIWLHNLHIPVGLRTNLWRAFYLLSILHYILMNILIVASVYFTIKLKRWDYLFIWIIILLSVATSIITVGEPLYRHHIMLLFYILGAFSINEMFKKRLNNWLSKS